MCTAATYQTRDFYMGRTLDYEFSYGDHTGDTVGEEGKTLDDAETEYVKIFANLKDFKKAQQKAELKNDFSEDFVKDLESKGISRDELEGMQIKIESNGNVGLFL